MLTEKYYTNFYAPDNADSMEESGGPVIIKDDPILTDDSQETSYEPGMVVIEEQTVTTEIDNEFPIASILGTPVNTEELLVNFDGKDYLVPRAVIEEETCYGEITASDGLSFANFPFVLVVSGESAFVLATPEPGTHTISAKIPDGKGIPKIIKMGKPSTIVNQVEEIIKSLGGTVDTKRRNLQNLISTLAEMAENGEIGEKTEVKSIRGTVSLSEDFHMDSLSVIRKTGIPLPTWEDVPDNYQASENKIVVWSTNATLDGQALASPVNVVWSDLNLNNLRINSIAVGNPDAVSKEFNKLTAICTIYYW